MLYRTSTPLLVAICVSFSANGHELLEASMLVSGETYGAERGYERVLLPESTAATLSDPGSALGHPNALAAYSLVCDEQSRSIFRNYSVSPDNQELESALRVAETFVPSPETVLGGFLVGPYNGPLEEGEISAFIMSADATRFGFPATVYIHRETAGIVAYRVGALGDPLAINVRFHYTAGSDSPSAVVTTFATDETGTSRWALVDVAVPHSAQPLRTASESVSGLATVNPEKGMTTGAITFNDTVDTLPPINLGSTNCNAAGASMVNLGLLSIGADIAVGVSLDTNTTLNMEGNVSADFISGDMQDDADLTFAGTTGTSSINYSLDYAATFCVVVDPIVGPTCNLSASLADGSVDLAAGMQSFTPFLLMGNADSPVCTGDALEPFLVGVDPSISLCDLEFGINGGLNIDPNIDYCVEGDSITISEALGAKQVMNEGDAVRVPATAGETVAYNATWNGLATLDGTLTVSPSIGITIPLLGDLNVPLPSFPFDLPNLDLEPFEIDTAFSIDYAEVNAGGCSASPGGTPLSNGSAVTLVMMVAAGLLIRSRQSRTEG